MVVAIIAILAGIAFAFINPKEIDYIEYDRSAEAIAVAAQNRLTEIRNAGDMSRLRTIGESDTNSSAAARAADADTSGGYRYIFNYIVEEGTIKRNADICYLFPFGSLETKISEHYFAVGFQSDTGQVGEVFYSEQPFAQATVAYLKILASSEEQRKTDNVGYYAGTWDSAEVAFANLPTPQISIVNYEELTVNIYLPEVKQLQEMGKEIGFIISLADEGGLAYSGYDGVAPLDITQTAIYSTFQLGQKVGADNPNGPVVQAQTIESGATYSLVLDTVKPCETHMMMRNLSKDGTGDAPCGVFEEWVKRSGAFQKPYLLGDNSLITVTVYCLTGETASTFPVDPTFMTRSASVKFNGWFNTCEQRKADSTDKTVDIACGRHLQNLGKLTEMQKKLVPVAPKAVDTNGDGRYEYEKYDLGMADAYTEGTEEIDPHIHKYVKDPTGSDGSYYEKDATTGYLVAKDGYVVDGYNYYKFDVLTDGSKKTRYALVDKDGKPIEGKDYTIDADNHYLYIGEGKEKERIPDPLYQSDLDPNTYYEDISQKYVYRSVVQTEIKLANQVNAIDFDSSDWKDKGKDIPFTPINLPYNFYYYGNYLTIKNLYVNAPFYAGLFGYAYHPRLYDILLVNPSVTSQVPANLAEIFEIGVGGLIGTSRDSSHINNCQLYMTPQADGTYDTNRRVQGECYVGGLIGFCEDEHIENCSASVYTGYINGAGKLSQYVGGLIGCITGDSELTNCYAAGNLTGKYVGGLVGYIVEDSDPSGDDYRIETCYTAGHIEFAGTSAAGLIGRITERAGNIKSALSAYGNYCVVIYGIKNGNVYKWETDAPIYGTFKGDGYEWMGTSDKDGAYYDAYLKGEFGGGSYFAGAVFKNNSKNYYIAQRGITYSGTSYLKTEGQTNTVQGIIDDIKKGKSEDLATLKKTVSDAQNKLYYLKKLQALEELNEFMLEVIDTVEKEPSTDAKGKQYVNDHLLGLEEDGAEMHSSTSGYIKVTASQALHAIYDGTFTDANDKSYTNQTITYEGKNHNDWLKGTSKIDTYTFMGFYNALKTAYEKLMTTPDDADSLAMVKRILGEDTGDTSKQFYKDGLFYKIFYVRLFYSIFGDMKDYYEDTVNDKNGELLFRHYRDDYADRGFLRLLCDLGMSEKGRENMLYKAQIKELETALDALKEYTKSSSGIIAQWKKSTSHQMYKYADTVSGYVTAAKKAAQSIYDNLNKSDYTISKLEADIEIVEDNLYELYRFYDETKVGKDENNNSIYIKDLVDVIDDKGHTGDMRNLRDVLNDYRRAAYLCGASYNSGVSRELDLLAKRLGEGGANVSALVDEFVQNATEQLNNDSGHRLKTATELRNAARGYDDGVDGSEKSDHLGFMYDYGNPYLSSSGRDKNPYTSQQGLEGDYYVDLDNGIYNNVFPYTVSPFTRFYPFPLVYGRELETSGDRPLYALFHYGDWLTEDLWA